MNISATASHFRMVFIGVLFMSFRVNTMIFSTFAIVPKMQICNISISIDLFVSTYLVSKNRANQSKLILTASDM